MTSSVTNSVKAVALIVLGLTLAATGIYFLKVDDAPGGVVPGFLLMFSAVLLVVRAARNRLPTWVRRTALAVGAVIAAFLAFHIHAATVAAPLFAQPPDVPSVSASAPSPQWAAAVDRARPMVRSAIVEQNLPGVSIAVGAGGRPENIVWAEGFGWRDVVTHTPVTPATRFNIGTAAPALTAAGVSASLGLTSTGTDSAADWSPRHVGEPEEDFPGFTFIHDMILRPIGIADPAQPLAGDRATFFVPATQWRGDTTDPRQGRRLMYMRDLACCADGKAFYSTPSDLVRFALATKADSVNGELAGGSVMSLVTRRDNGIVVAVASNIAYANTAALALKVADVFAQQK
jgi:CubicO group peptidase (beta-lactamase class C family)